MLAGPLAGPPAAATDSTVNYSVDIILDLLYISPSQTQHDHLIFATDGQVQANAPGISHLSLVITPSFHTDVITQLLADHLNTTTMSVRARPRHVITDLHIMMNFMEKSPQGNSKEKKESPDVYWSVVQAMQGHEQFLEGMLLKNLEVDSIFPYMHYVVFDTTHQDFSFGSKLGRIIQEAFGPGKMEHLGGYEEAYTCTTPSIALLPKRPSGANAAYIISAFKSVDDNLEHLMGTWSIWSGADFIVANVPTQLELQRITLHKVVSRNTSFAFVLMCELGEALSDLSRTRDFIEKIRSRECGYTSIFVIDHFF